MIRRISDLGTAASRGQQPSSSILTSSPEKERLANTDVSSSALKRRLTVEDEPVSGDQRRGNDEQATPVDGIPIKKRNLLDAVNNLLGIVQKIVGGQDEVFEAVPGSSGVATLDSRRSNRVDEAGGDWTYEADDWAPHLAQSSRSSPRHLAREQQACPPPIVLKLIKRINARAKPHSQKLVGGALVGDDLVMCDVGGRQVFTGPADSRQRAKWIFTQPNSVKVFGGGGLSARMWKPSGHFQAAAMAVESGNAEIFGLKDNLGVHSFDSRTKKFVNSVFFEPQMRTFGLAPLGLDRFVCFDDARKQLVIIDPHSEVPEKTIPLCSEIFQMGAYHPSAIRFVAVDNFSKEPRIAMTDWGRNFVFVVDLDGRLLGVAGEPGTSGRGRGVLWAPHGAAFLPDGRLIVSDSKNDRLQVFTRDYEFAQTLALPPGRRRPTGLSLSVRGGGRTVLLVVFHVGTPGGVQIFEVTSADGDDDADVSDDWDGVGESRADEMDLDADTAAFD